MIASEGGRFRRIGRPMRRVVGGVAFVGVMFAGGATIGLAGDGADGRDGTSVPGEPTDEPAPPPVDSDTGRGGSPVGKPSRLEARTAESLDAPAAPETIRDTGRGGVDPAVGPFRVAQTAEDAESVQSLDVGSVDSDSGKAPRPKRSNQSAQSSAGDSAAATSYVDQDVPGAPTGGPDGSDEPSNDADG